ncbi:MAG: hypothetical protein K0S07_600 [Chlamydiales bacterium]|jgi:hypothetical protein|nr:hypothetical protein [Chlamydiales bacterium]
MYTLENIVRHVVLDEPYSSLPAPSIDDIRDSRGYNLLLNASTPEIVAKVRMYAQQRIPSLLEVTRENATQYLAAAKMVDLEDATSQFEEATYKIRSLCILNSLKINLMNAFSTPPLYPQASIEHRHGIGAWLLTELDHAHETVLKAPSLEMRTLMMRHIYQYAEREARLIPKMVKLIEKIVSKRYLAAINSAKHQPEKTLTIYQGPAGSGKKDALKKRAAQTGLKLSHLVQSTECIKLDIQKKTAGLYGGQDVHLLSFSLFKLFVEAMKEYNGQLSSIQEGCFFGADPLRELLGAGLKAEIYDFDGDFKALSLRLLAQYKNQKGSKLSFDTILDLFKSCRKKRPELLDLVASRPEDRYHLSYVTSKGQVLEDKDPRSVASQPEQIEREIAEAKGALIEEAHLCIFGAALADFVGLTIEEAFKRIE